MILKAENIQKIYGSRKVVKGISLEVQQGEIIGLLGPNGAGKTTSFYMIVGMIKPNAGKIFLNDEEITKDAMYKRAQKGIGYLAQEASIFRKLSVEDNIMAVLQFTGRSKKEQKIKLESLIEEFNIGMLDLLNIPCLKSLKITISVFSFTIKSFILFNIIKEIG